MVGCDFRHLSIPLAHTSRSTWGNPRRSRVRRLVGRASGRIEAALCALILIIINDLRLLFNHHQPDIGNFHVLHYEVGKVG